MTAIDRGVIIGGGATRRTGGVLAAVAATAEFYRRRRWHGEAEIRMAYLDTLHTTQRTLLERPAMSLIDRLDAKFGRFAVPNLTVFLIAGQVLTYVASCRPAPLGRRRVRKHRCSCRTRCLPANGGG